MTAFKVTQGDHTHGEVKALIAPLVGKPVEEIISYILIVRGTCEDCGGDDAYTVLDNTDNEDAFALDLSRAIVTKLMMP